MKTYIFADLIQRNTEYHGKKLRRKHGIDFQWVNLSREICKKEKRLSRSSGREKAASGFLWRFILGLSLSTREIYFLITCWLLELDENVDVEFKTEEFKDLCIELKDSITAGIEGEVEEINQEECEVEWEKIRPLAVSIHEIYENYMEEKIL